MSAKTRMRDVIYIFFGSSLGKLQWFHHCRRCQVGRGFLASASREGLFGVVRSQKACHESVGLSRARKLDRTHHFCFYLVVLWLLHFSDSYFDLFGCFPSFISLLSKVKTQVNKETTSISPPNTTQQLQPLNFNHSFTFRMNENQPYHVLTENYLF